MAKAPKMPGGMGAPAKRGRPAFPKAAKEPLAPPNLAKNMRGLSKMPKMMRTGGKVSGCK